MCALLFSSGNIIRGNDSAGKLTGKASNVQLFSPAPGGQARRRARPPVPVRVQAEGRPGPVRQLREELRPRPDRQAPTDLQQDLQEEEEGESQAGLRLIFRLIFVRIIRKFFNKVS